MRTRSAGIAIGGAAVGLLTFGAVAVGAPPAPPAPPAPGAPRYEYAVRCVFRGTEAGILANYKLRCNELGSEITVCGPLDFEACRLRLINEMGQQGWRYVAADDTDGGLGPSGSVSFERETAAAWTPAPPLPAP